MNKNINKFENFMDGFTAAVQLVQRAGENGFFIEYTCLVASIIDGLLRIGLILQHQLETKSEEILDSLLFQSNEDKIISERQIFKMALDKKVIPEKLFNDLGDLYKQRNRVVHRYIISDVSTKDVLNIGIQYEQIKYLVSECVKKLEDGQIQIGVGMTRAGKNTPEENLLKTLNEMSAKKHNDAVLNHALKKQN